MSFGLSVYERLNEVLLKFKGPFTPIRSTGSLLKVVNDIKTVVIIRRYFFIYFLEFEACQKIAANIRVPETQDGCKFREAALNTQETFGKHNYFGLLPEGLVS